jgi:hypothetical protein
VVLAVDEEAGDVVKQLKRAKMSLKMELSLARVKKNDIAKLRTRAFYNRIDLRCVCACVTLQLLGSISRRWSCLTCV